MRILLADNAALLREGLAGLLAAAGHEVVAVGGVVIDPEVLASLMG
ncbi:DNA-binding response regulator, partial [Actinomyces sp. AC-19-1]|nr:DNA-binding response regulator [Actinomyces sp. 217892]